MNLATKESVLKNLIYEISVIKNTGGGNPRIHPNGFIQLDLGLVEDSWHESHKKGHSGSSRRLHVWNPSGIELPHQDTTNEIHDHVFDMRSYVVKGIQWQILYDFIPWEPNFSEPPGAVTHEKYQAVYDKNSDSRLVPTGIKGWLVERNKFPVYSGRAYFQHAFTLHDSKPQGCTVTVMTKTKINEGEATVVCPVDSPPDNSFDRVSAMPEAEIWIAIEAALA